MAGVLIMLGALHSMVQRQFSADDFIQSISSRRTTSEFPIGLDG